MNIKYVLLDIINGLVANTMNIHELQQLQKLITESFTDQEKKFEELNKTLDQQRTELDHGDTRNRFPIEVRIELRRCDAQPSTQ